MIIYDRVLTEQERVEVEQYLMSKWFAMLFTPDAKVLDFGPGADVGTIVSNAAGIAWTVPYGTNVTALAPVFALSSGATCTVNGNVVQSGDTLNFANPVELTVTSSDSLVTHVYTVALTMFGSAEPKGEMNLSTYDTTEGTSILNPIANLLALVPSGTGTQTTDINYGSFAGVLPGITDNNTFSVVWDGWLDVTKSGHGDYSFGTAPEIHLARQRIRPMTRRKTQQRRGTGLRKALLVQISCLLPKQKFLPNESNFTIPNLGGKSLISHLKVCHRVTGSPHGNSPHHPPRREWAHFPWQARGRIPQVPCRARSRWPHHSGTLYGNSNKRRVALREQVRP